LICNDILHTKVNQAAFVFWFFMGEFLQLFDERPHDTG
jgi:hypothetical protein